MAIVVTSGSEIVEIDEGLHGARLESVEETVSTYDPTDPKDQYKLKFEIIDGDFAGEKLNYWVNRKTRADGSVSAHPKSTLYSVLCALNGVRELSEGDTFEIDELVGRTCIIDVVEKKGQDGNFRPKIKEVRKAAKSSRAAARAASADSDFE